jgi:hypothetical protein
MLYEMSIQRHKFSSHPFPPPSLYLCFTVPTYRRSYSNQLSVPLSSSEIAGIKLVGIMHEIQALSLTFKWPGEVRQENLVFLINTFAIGFKYTLGRFVNFYIKTCLIKTRETLCVACSFFQLFLPYMHNISLKFQKLEISLRFFCII